MCKIFTVAFAEFNIETAEAVKGERVPKDFEKEVAEILSATRARPCGKECFTARNLALYTLGMLPRFGEFRTALIRHAYAGKCMRCRHADGAMQWVALRVPRCPERMHSYKLDRVERGRPSPALRKFVTEHVTMCSVCQRHCKKNYPRLHEQCVSGSPKSSKLGVPDSRGSHISNLGF